MADNNRDLQERRVILSEIREQRFQRAQADRESRSSGSGWSPGRAARTITTRSGTYSGKGTLAALLLVGFVIVAIRLVADAEERLCTADWQDHDERAFALLQRYFDASPAALVQRALWALRQ